MTDRRLDIKVGDGGSCLGTVAGALFWILAIILLCGGIRYGYRWAFPS